MYNRVPVFVFDPVRSPEAPRAFGDDQMGITRPLSLSRAPADGAMNDFRYDVHSLFPSLHPVAAIAPGRFLAYQSATENR